MPRRSKSRRRTRINSVSGIQSKKLGFQLKPLRPYRQQTVSLIRHDYHLPSRRRVLTLKAPWINRQDPRNYNEQTLKRYSRRLPNYYALQNRTPITRKIDAQKICRRRRIRKAVLFASGNAGMRGALPPAVRRLRNRRNRNAPVVNCRRIR